MHLEQSLLLNGESIPQISDPECHGIVGGAEVPVAKDGFPGFGDDRAHSLYISGF
jgi:hypothetical protein